MALTVGVASGERAQVGTLLVAFKADVSPNRLPRDHFVPAAVHLHTDFSTTDGALVPQLRGLTIELSRRGKLFNTGLSTCPIARLEPTTPELAMQSCGNSLVGRGTLHAIVTLPGQGPFFFKAKLFAFNGASKKGQGTVLVLVYGPKPPASFVLPFSIHQSGFELGTKLTTKLPKDAGTWAHMIDFDIVFKRIYSYKGREHSFISADCPAPKGFTGGVLPFARATYHFADTPGLNTVIVRGCKVDRGA